jgi:hypothetical protein
MNARHISRTETANLIRAALKRTFPGVKFSVRSSTYSGGGAIDIAWMDGPTWAAVDLVVKQYESKRFDGMIDMGYSVDHWLLPDGSAIVARDPGTLGQRGTHTGANNPAPAGAELVHFGSGYVSASRKISDAFRDRLRAAYAALTQGERVRLISRTEAWRQSLNVNSWSCLDADLAEFGRDAPDVLSAIARQVAA